MSVVRRLALFFVFGALASASTAADFPTLPNDSWYRVEIVIFERLADVDVTGTQEILVSRAPRAYPLDVIAFDDESGRAAAYPLDAETRAQPVVPIIDPATIAANRSPQARSAALPS